MISAMIVRCVKLALVSSVLFAALGANPGPSFAVSSSSAASLTQDAYAALSSGNAAKSIGLYSQAIDSRELGPEALANALFNRALAYQGTGQNDKAVEDYTTALSLDAMPSDLRARVLYNRGLAQQQIQRPALAIEDFTSALLIHSNFAEAYLARGNALRDSGQYLFSISDYERALKYNHPQAARVFYGEAQAYEKLKRPSEAVHLLKQALAADSTFAPAREKLAALGQVAENDDSESDPILTASAGVSPTSSVEITKDQLPKGVEPPAGLVASVAVPVAEASVAEMASPEAPAQALVADAKAAMPKAMAEAAAKPMVVAEVPKIPAQADVVANADVAQAPVAAGAKPAKLSKPKAVVAAAPEVVVDDIQTASTAPVAEVQSGWVVQISSATTEEAAWTSFKTMQKSHKVLAPLKPAVVKADLGAKGTFYRVRLQGFDNQQAAQSACGKLKAGGVACFAAKAGG
jgi:tetratricopeptide (TPR) repeat protein